MSEALSSPEVQPILQLVPEQALEVQAPLEIVPEPQSLNKLQTLKRAAQTGIVLAEFTPANEAIRASAFIAGEAMSHSPAVGALTLGLSTLAIEGGAALASASLLNTETSKRFNEYLKKRLDSVGYNTDQEMSRFSKAGLTFIGGSAVGMALENFDRPDRSVAEQRKFGLFTAAWLAGTMAVAGAMGSEAIANPLVAATVAGSVGIAATGRKIKNGIKHRREVEQLSAESEPTVWLDHDKFGNEYGIIRDTERLEKAAFLEQDVWTEKNYGDLTEEGYDKYIAHSLTFGAFNKKGECVAVERMFKAEDGVVPPFLDEDMPYDDETERAELIELAKDGKLEELGTVAVAPELRGKKLNLRLFRLAYRDARERGVTHWGIIMEPERVKNMNEHHGFTFRQLGDAVDYQGGACAAHVMSLEDVDKTMSKQHPINHYWFTKLKIKP